MKQLNFKIPVFLKNKAILGAFCVVAALVIGFLFVPMAANADTSSVVRAKVNISEGDKITADMLETVTMSKKNLPEGSFSNTVMAVGKYASVTMTAHDIVTIKKVSSTGSLYNLEKGSYLMSVSVKNFADALSGKLQSGDIVTVFFPPVVSNAVTGTSLSEASNPPELHYVKVVAVTASDGSDAQYTPSESKSQDVTKNTIPSTVTLLVNERQAQILAGQENNTVHLALAYRGSGDKAKQLLDEQTEVFTSTTSSAANTSSTASDTSSTASQTSSVSQTSSASQTQASSAVQSAEVTK